MCYRLRHESYLINLEPTFGISIHCKQYCKTPPNIILLHKKRRSFSLHIWSIFHQPLFTECKKFCSKLGTWIWNNMRTKCETSVQNIALTSWWWSHTFITVLFSLRVNVLRFIYLHLSRCSSVGDPSWQMWKTSNFLIASDREENFSFNSAWVNKLWSFLSCCINLIKKEMKNKIQYQTEYIGIRFQIKYTTSDEIDVWNFAMSS